jgi:hypothetical protein
MTTPTPEELLRLARKAWPDTAADLREPDEEDPLSVEYTEHDCTARVFHELEEDSVGLTITHPERAREALHAALLVLAGELSVQRDDDGRLAVSYADKGYMVELDRPKEDP